MSNLANDQTAPQPAPKKTNAETPQSVLLVPYPKIVFLYPTFLLAIVAAIWTHFLRTPLPRIPSTTISPWRLARCSSACSR